MLKYIFLTVFILITRSAASETEFEGLLNIKLYHSFSKTHLAEYTERGNITVHGKSITINNLPLTQKDREKLKALAADDLFYRLKSTVVNSDKTETEFLSSVKACMLAKSALSDFITISLDHQSNAVAVSLGVPSNYACQGANVDTSNLAKFNTKVYINPISAGTVPDTASYIQKLEREREAKERGDVKDNRSFFAKYWMYIVPVVILMVLSSAANPEAAGGAPARQ